MFTHHQEYKMQVFSGFCQQEDEEEDFVRKIRNLLMNLFILNSPEQNI